MTHTPYFITHCLWTKEKFLKGDFYSSCHTDYSGDIQKEIWSCQRQISYFYCHQQNFHCCIVILRTPGFSTGHELTLDSDKTTFLPLFSTNGWGLGLYKVNSEVHLDSLCLVHLNDIKKSFLSSSLGNLTFICLFHESH